MLAIASAIASLRFLSAECAVDPVESRPVFAARLQQRESPTRSL
jgi:hypothetical protein